MAPVWNISTHPRYSKPYFYEQFSDKIPWQFWRQRGLHIVTCHLSDGIVLLHSFRISQTLRHRRKSSSTLTLAPGVPLSAHVDRVGLRLLGSRVTLIFVCFPCFDFRMLSWDVSDLLGVQTKIEKKRREEEDLPWKSPKPKTGKQDHSLIRVVFFIIVIRWSSNGVQESTPNSNFGILIERNSPPLKAFLCWVVSKPRTRRKRTPPEEQSPKLIKFGYCSSEGVLFRWVLELETIQQINPPGGEEFFRSTFAEWASYDQNVCRYLFVYQCFLTTSITPHSDLLHFHFDRESPCLFPVLPIRQWLYRDYANVCSNETSETLTLMKLKCHGNKMYASLWNINACVTFFHVYAHLDIFACIYVLIDIDIRHSHTHVCTFIRVSMCVHKYFSHE